MITSSRPLAVVTGASSGIGYELAKIFAQNNYNLIVAAEDARIVDCADEFAALGVEAMPVQVDLAAPDGAKKLYDAIRQTSLPVDAIALNAGVGLGGDFVRDTDLAKEENMINLNILSTVRLAKYVLRDMVAQNSGKVLFTASIASTMPGTFEAVYNGTKAFVLSFAEALRSELKDTNITVTALMPGPTETNFFHRAEMDDTRVGAGKKDDPALVARQGFDALMSGDDAIIGGGMKSKMMGMMNEIMPEKAKAAMHYNLSKPGSAKQ